MCRKLKSANLAEDEQGFPLLVLLCVVPHVVLHYDRGIGEVVLVLLIFLLSGAVVFWRRSPYRAALAVGLVLVAWTMLMLGADSDALDLLPFLCAVPLFVYGPARYGDRLNLNIVVLSAALVWSAVSSLVLLDILPDGTGSWWTIYSAFVLLQWVFYSALVLMGRSQRSEDVARDAELASLHRQGRLEMTREIHDVLSRSLTVINVQATAGAAAGDLSALKRIQELSGSSLVEMRGLMASLRTTGKVVDAALMDKEEIVAVMGRMLDGFREIGLQLNTVFPTEADRDLLVHRESAEVQFTNYRIFGECLTNVVRHQGPDSRVLVSAMPDFPENTLHVRIESWAGSQDRRPGRVPGGGTGLTGMRSRVEALGGTITWSPPSAGNGHFLVEAQLPIVLSEDAQAVVTAESVEAVESVESARSDADVWGHP